MDKMVLSKGDLPKFIDELIKKNTVYAPIENNGTIIFNQIKKSNEAKIDYCNSQYPPKSLIFNQTETLFKFKPGPKGDIEPIKIDEKKIIFGIRPCDAKSLAILDHAFSGEFKDPYFLIKRSSLY